MTSAVSTGTNPSQEEGHIGKEQDIKEKYNKLLGEIINFNQQEFSQDEETFEENRDQKRWYNRIQHALCCLLCCCCCCPYDDKTRSLSIFIIGMRGVGKSTLINVIGRALRPNVKAMYAKTGASERNVTLKPSRYSVRRSNTLGDINLIDNKGLSSATEGDLRTLLQIIQNNDHKAVLRSLADRHEHKPVVGIQYKPNLSRFPRLPADGVIFVISNDADEALVKAANEILSALTAVHFPLKVIISKADKPRSKALDKLEVDFNSVLQLPMYTDDTYGSKIEQVEVPVLKAFLSVLEDSSRFLSDFEPPSRFEKFMFNFPEVRSDPSIVGLVIMSSVTSALLDIFILNGFRASFGLLVAIFSIVVYRLFFVNH